MSKKEKNIKKYEIKPIYLSLKDEKSVKYHVKKKDYFGTIATILKLIIDNFNDKEDVWKSKTLTKTALNNLIADLQFMQENYEIRPKLEKAKNKEKKDNTKRQA